MKTLFISGAFILAIVSLGSTAFALENRSNTSICNSIPPAKPTGGATAVRLQALEQCYKGFPQGTIQYNPALQEYVHSFLQQDLLVELP